MPSSPDERAPLKVYLSQSLPLLFVVVHSIEADKVAQARRIWSKVLHIPHRRRQQNWYFSCSCYLELCRWPLDENANIFHISMKEREISKQSHETEVSRPSKLGWVSISALFVQPLSAVTRPDSILPLLTLRCVLSCRRPAPSSLQSRRLSSWLSIECHHLPVLERFEH